MALTKIVDGKEVKLTKAEEKAVRDEWAAEEIEAAKPKPPSLAERVEALETDVAAMKLARDAQK